MKHLSLFSGIGGLDLAAEWAGMSTVAFCERDPFCQKVLAKHWPTVPIFGDIHELTSQSLRDRGVERIDIISGGFPCQPFSHAGEQRGKEDDRYLWPQMLRVIKECKPAWVVGENVTGIIDLALDDVLVSLEGEGYEVRPIVFPASAVGAWHQRQRVFIVAHTNSISSGSSHRNAIHERWATGESWGEGIPKAPRWDDGFAISDTQSTSQDVAHAKRSDGDRRRERERSGKGRSRGYRANGATSPKETQGLCDVVPNADSASGQGRESATGREGQGFSRWTTTPTGGEWISEPAVGRVVNGIPRGLDIGKRLKALGNAVVPQQAYPIFKTIMDIENGEQLFTPNHD